MQRYHQFLLATASRRVTDSRGWKTAALVILTTLLGLASFYWRVDRRRRSVSTSHLDPPLLKKYTSKKCYRVDATGYSYPGIRVVYRDHPQADKLPAKPRPLPLLVFVHGLGGCGAQFAPLLTSLINVGPCLVIDLPGCGQSDFAPRDWDAYSTTALACLLDVVIESYRDTVKGQGVVLVAHSMGCSLSALLSSPQLHGSSLFKHVVGLIAMCPRASPMSQHQLEATHRILRIPGFIFDLLRKFDRKGGVNSRSVLRMVGEAADLETRKLQLHYNSQSKTPVWRRMTFGLLPHDDGDGPHGGLPDSSLWQKLQCPVFLLAGESDPLCPPQEIHHLASALGDAWSVEVMTAKENTAPTASETSNELCEKQTPVQRVLKTKVLPAPASHALPFSPSTIHTLSGLIQSFLATHVDARLSLGWQLTYLSDSGKWDVKNLEKWQKTAAISRWPIGQKEDASGNAPGGLFMAMKTMREVDDVHCPKRFAQEWSGKVKAVVDISHDSPVYDPKGLVEGGIEYHKSPSVSKLPPTEEEVESFEKLIDRLRAETSTSNGACPTVIAVHCHYGFNRTGYFIICYLVDKLGWKLQDAVDEFARCRPPGVKHAYFVDALFARYCDVAGRS